MSRLEKTMNKKNSKNKYKFICRIVFLSLMIIIVGSSIFLIDYRINKILGDDSKDNLMEYIDIF